MIAVIDYGAGNTASVTNVLDELSVDYKVTKSEYEICDAEKIIFPGVGEASFAVKKLHMNNLFSLLKIVRKPLLGICLGMQLFCNKSDEGNIVCLGIIPVDCKQFEKGELKVPHMGWNSVKVKSGNVLFHDVPDNSFFYFAHSYYMPLNESSIASANYGIDFSAAVQKDNYFGVQFHPEKSGQAGVQLIKNFLVKC